MLVKPLTACVPFAFVFYFIYHIVFVYVLFDSRDKLIRIFIIIITLPFLCECSIFFSCGDTLNYSSQYSAPGALQLHNVLTYSITYV